MAQIELSTILSCFSKKRSNHLFVKIPKFIKTELLPKKYNFRNMKQQEEKNTLTTEQDNMIMIYLPLLDK
jgi:hypothetical protein